MYKDITIKYSAEFTQYTDVILVAGDLNAYRIVFETPWELDNCKFMVTAKRSDGNAVFDFGTVDGNNAIYVMANSMYSVAGDLTLRLTIEDNSGTVLTACEVIVEVVSGNEEGSSAENLTPALEKILSSIREIEEDVQNQIDSLEVTSERISDGAIKDNHLDLGLHNQVAAKRSHAIGEANIIDKEAENSLAVGLYNEVNGKSSLAEGEGTKALGKDSHSEGCKTQALGEFSHAEGRESKTNGLAAHAEGECNNASGAYSHAEGYYTQARKRYSHTEGFSTVATADGQHVEGKFNKEDDTKLHIAGNGTQSMRSNAYTLDWLGNAWFAGTIEPLAIILKSDTKGSTARYKITVSDGGVISATFYDGTEAPSTGGSEGGEIADID